MEVTWSPGSLAFIKDKRIRKALRRALRKAGRDALLAIRAEAKRQTRSRVRIRAGYLAGDAFKLRYPGKLVATPNLSWRMDVSGRAVPLGEYPRRQTKKGVSVEVQRGKRQLIRSAFLATARTGRKSVFLRPTDERYPMGHRLGMSVADSMKDGQTPRAALERGVSVLGSAFERLFALEIQR